MNKSSTKELLINFDIEIFFIYGILNTQQKKKHHQCRSQARMKKEDGCVRSLKTSVKLCQIS